MLDALRLLKDVEGIATIKLTGMDVIRHRLVGAIIDRFEADDAKRAEEAEAKKPNAPPVNCARRSGDSPSPFIED